jgi:hypothetical protein
VVKEETLGLRWVGTLGGLVFLGGPTLTVTEGINLFTFRNDTGEYLGSTYLGEYFNIRKWLVVNAVLYAAVGNTNGGGSVLRWTGVFSSIRDPPGRASQEGRV